jgi:hypothetical protein
MVMASRADRLKRGGRHERLFMREPDGAGPGEPDEPNAVASTIRMTNIVSRYTVALM